MTTSANATKHIAIQGVIIYCQHSRYVFGSCGTSIKVFSLCKHNYYEFIYTLVPIFAS